MQLLKFLFNHCIDQHQHQIKMCQQPSPTQNTAFFLRSVYTGELAMRINVDAKWLVSVYNSWLCQILCPKKGFIFQKNSFHMVKFMSIWCAGVGDKKNLKILTITRTNRTHLLTMLYFQEYLDYDRRSVGHCIINGLCWCVILQVTMIYIFPLLKFLDLCMPPLHVHVVARQSVHSTGTLLVSHKWTKLGYMLLLHADKKAYMGSPIAPSHLILSDLERLKSRSLKFQSLISQLELLSFSRNVWRWKNLAHGKGGCLGVGVGGSKILAQW